MSAIALLRAKTASLHDAVDAAFGGYDLTDAASYRGFLEAHARALPEAESLAAAVWRAIRPRSPLLEADLRALGASSALPAPVAQEAGPRHWGALYVVEGSRLGGGFLAKRVAPDLPTAYLSAIHQPGEWRAIRHAVDKAAADRDAEWMAQMVAGAEATFRLYQAAAA